MASHLSSSRLAEAGRMPKRSKTSETSRNHISRKTKKKVEKDRVYDEPDLGFAPDFRDNYSRHFSSQFSRSFDDREVSRKRNEVIFLHHQVSSS
jgi:hypothetical protein